MPMWNYILPSHDSPVREGLLLTRCRLQVVGCSQYPPCPPGQKSFGFGAPYPQSKDLTARVQGLGFMASGMESCIRMSAILLTQRVQVPNDLVFGFWVIVITVQVLGKYMIIGYWDPQGKGLANAV